jgi:hypothetical protein
MKQALMVAVYRDGLGDATNGGVSSSADRLMLAERKTGAKYVPPTVFVPPASYLKAEMRNEVITAEKRCDVLIGAIHNLQDDLGNQPNNHSILGSVKHVNQLLLEILEFLNG